MTFIIRVQCCEVMECREISPDKIFVRDLSLKDCEHNEEGYKIAEEKAKSVFFKRQRYAWA